VLSASQHRSSICLDIEVLLSSENVDDFEKKMFTIRVEERLAFSVYRPESFATGDVEGA
jgi:hypothetical protein